MCELRRRQRSSGTLQALPQNEQNTHEGVYRGEKFREMYVDILRDPAKLVTRLAYAKLNSSLRGAERESLTIDLGY